MNRILSLSAIAAAMALPAARAHALLKRTFVSATGGDANSCTATAGSTVIGNAISLQTADSSILSDRDNKLTGNITEGTPTGVLTMQ